MSEENNDQQEKISRLKLLSKLLKTGVIKLKNDFLGFTKVILLLSAITGSSLYYGYLSELDRDYRKNPVVSLNINTEVDEIMHQLIRIGIKKEHIKLILPYLINISREYANSPVLLLSFLNNMSLDKFIFFTNQIKSREKRGIFKILYSSLKKSPNLRKLVENKKNYIWLTQGYENISLQAFEILHKEDVKSVIENNIKKPYDREKMLKILYSPLESNSVHSLFLTYYPLKKIKRKNKTDVEKLLELAKKIGVKEINRFVNNFYPNEIEENKKSKRKKVKIPFRHQNK